MPKSLIPGQIWRYRAPSGFEDSRIIIGALVAFENHEPLVCFQVFRAPQKAPDGSLSPVDIPFIPMLDSAFRATVVVREGVGAVSPVFAQQYVDWKSDPRGMSYFSVPFEGRLDLLIAKQMAALVDTDHDLTAPAG